VRAKELNPTSLLASNLVLRSIKNNNQPSQMGLNVSIKRGTKQKVVASCVYLSIFSIIIIKIYGTICNREKTFQHVSTNCRSRLVAFTLPQTAAIHTAVLSVCKTDIDKIFTLPQTAAIHTAVLSVW